LERSAQAARLPRRPELVAHRGWAAEYPENTRAALEAAIEAGARWVEVDVQLSSDGRPVLFHDRSLERMCGVAGPVHLQTLAGLRALPCAERSRFGEKFAKERIAELSELVDLLRAHPQVFAFVEIKRAAIESFDAERVLAAVVPLLEPVRSRVALISFSLPFLALARSKTAFPLGEVFDHWHEREAPEARAVEAEFLFCDVDGLPAGGPIDAGKAKLALYEVADPKIALDLAARGADLIETFAIGDMIEALRETGPRTG